MRCKQDGNERLGWLVVLYVKNEGSEIDLVAHLHTEGNTQHIGQMTLFRLHVVKFEIGFLFD